MSESTQSETEPLMWGDKNATYRRVTNSLIPDFVRLQSCLQIVLRRRYIGTVTYVEMCICILEENYLV